MENMAIIERPTTIESFKMYADVMKKSQDKYERLFKVRRDIVIESKRIIFLLLSIDSESKKVTIIDEAEKKLQFIIGTLYKKIAAELEDEDPYKYYRAVSPGNQEFIEALTLLEYMRDGEIKGPDSCSCLPFVPTLDYVLGLADLTGELMRLAVSSVGTGNIQIVDQTCYFLRKMYSVMMALPYNRDLNSKLSVMEASVGKVERIQYKLHIVGNQTPPNVIGLFASEQDEGYQD